MCKESWDKQTWWSRGLRVVLRTSNLSKAYKAPFKAMEEDPLSRDHAGQTLHREMTLVLETTGLTIRILPCEIKRRNSKAILLCSSLSNKRTMITWTILHSVAPQRNLRHLILWAPVKTLAYKTFLHLKAVKIQTWHHLLDSMVNKSSLNTHSLLIWVSRSSCRTNKM